MDVEVLPLLLLVEFVCGGAAALFTLLAVLALSAEEEEEEDGDTRGGLAPASFRGVWPGVSTRPFIARSLAAALRAEHLFPRTRGSGGGGGGGVRSADLLVVLADEVSLPESPPVDALPLLEPRPRFLPGRPAPRDPVGASCPRWAERVRRRPPALPSRSDSEEEEDSDDRERLPSPGSSLVLSSPPSGGLPARLFLGGCLFSYVLLWWAWRVSVDVEQPDDGEEERADSWLLWRLRGRFWTGPSGSPALCCASRAATSSGPADGCSSPPVPPCRAGSLVSDELSTRLLLG